MQSLSGILLHKKTSVNLFMAKLQSIISSWFFKIFQNFLVSDKLQMFHLVDPCLKSYRNKNLKKFINTEIQGKLIQLCIHIIGNMSSYIHYFLPSIYRLKPYKNIVNNENLFIFNGFGDITHFPKCSVSTYLWRKLYFAISDGNYYIHFFCFVKCDGNTQSLCS